MSIAPSPGLAVALQTRSTSELTLKLKENLLRFPEYFILPDLMSIIAPVFAYGTSPYEKDIDRLGRDWLTR
jgi:hypothetical protein